MKAIATLVTTLFAVTAFAADAQPAKQPEPKAAVAAPAKKEEAKPAATKSAPAKSEGKKAEAAKK